MKFCKCKFSYVFDHECNSATAPCLNSDKLSNDNSHNFMKNLSKEEVRTAEEFFRELFKPDFSTQQTWNSNFKHFNTFDMIQFAESYASQFKSQSEAVGWISVKERLPEPLIRVLTFDGLAIDFGRYFHSTKYGSIFGRHGWGQTYNITHWQPLPSNPKHN